MRFELGLMAVTTRGTRPAGRPPNFHVLIGVTALIRRCAGTIPHFEALRGACWGRGILPICTSGSATR